MMMSPSSKIIFSSGIPWQTSLLMEVHTLFGKTVISKWCRNTAVFCCVVIDQFVYLGGAHPCVNMFCNVIKNRCVERCTFFDLFNLCRCLEHTSVMGQCVLRKLKVIFCHQFACGIFIFFPAATPAEFISFHNKNLL